MVYMNTREILRNNVITLMVHKYGKENMYKTNQESKERGCEISIGVLQRIKSMDTDIRMSVLESIANFFELQPWQLLVENIDATNPPVLREISQEERELYESIKNAAKKLAHIAEQ